MKKIINNKLYNTDTAKEITAYDNGYSGRDFKAVHEILFKKKTGEYFIYGWGGPMSKYAKSVGCNSWSGSEDITPLTVDEAKAWMEAYASADDYIAEFGDIEE